MFCTVYLLREDGRRLSNDEVKARGGVEGYLVVEPPPVIPGLNANLLADEVDHRQLLPELQHVHILKVRGGVLLRGLLVNPADYSSVSQAWWCVPSSHGSQAPRSVSNAGDARAFSTWLAAPRS